MKLQFLTAACAVALSLSFAGSAFAATAVYDDPIVAKLNAPVATKTKVIAGGAVFRCEGDECVATARSSETFDSATCKAIAKRFGGVASFGDGVKELDGDKLGACNAGSDTRVAKR